jgi:hypothetical protein
VKRPAILIKVRDYLFDEVGDGIAGSFTDVKLQRFLTEELLSLPSKNIYKEEVWAMPLSENVQDYTLPTGTFKLEIVERNDGSSTTPAWNEISGWDTYGNTLHLDFLPYISMNIRGHLKMFFADLTDDNTDIELEDDKTEALVWGIVVRCYKALIAFYRGSQSWDSVTKPGDVGIGSVQGWLRDAKQEQKEIIQRYATSARPRDINLTG